MEKVKSSSTKEIEETVSVLEITSWPQLVDWFGEHPGTNGWHVIPFHSPDLGRCGFASWRLIHKETREVLHPIRGLDDSDLGGYDEEVDRASITYGFLFGQRRKLEKGLEVDQEIKASLQGLIDGMYRDFRSFVEDFCSKLGLEERMLSFTPEFIEVEVQNKRNGLRVHGKENGPYGITVEVSGGDGVWHSLSGVTGLSLMVSLDKGVEAKLKYRVL